MLSTNKDRQGSEFVSMIEAFKYPIFGSQWHPEKNNFEWGTKLGPGAIPHGADATAVSQYAANFVVAAARRSEHAFASPGAEDAAFRFARRSRKSRFVEPAPLTVAHTRTRIPLRFKGGRPRAPLRRPPPRCRRRRTCSS